MITVRMINRLCRRFQATELELFQMAYYWKYDRENKNQCVLDCINMVEEDVVPRYVVEYVREEIIPRMITQGGKDGS